MYKGKKPPRQEHNLPAPEEFLQGYSINDGALGHIAIVDKAEGDDHKTCGYHVVDCLIVADLEFQGQERLSEPEHFLRALFADIVVVFYLWLLLFVDVLGYFTTELDQCGGYLAV